MAYSTPYSRWVAVQARDPAAADAFVYAVHTTHIYCRPTCPARLARKANVSFYDTALEAVERGFRACKRCKPESAEGMPEDAAVQAVRAYVASLEDGTIPGSLAQMAKASGLSKWHFHRTFIKVVGTTPGEWAKQRKSGSQVATQHNTPNLTESSSCPALSDTSLTPAALSPLSTDSLTKDPSLDADFDLNFEMTDEDWAKFVSFDGAGDILTAPYDYKDNIWTLEPY